MNDLTFGSAISLARAIREKKVSCRELVDAHLVQIERVNPPLNAIVRALAATAQQQAREADEAITRGDSVGPLHGTVVRCGTSAEGLPIGVQAVARPWREDVALALAHHVETALGGYQRPALATSA